MPQLESVIFDCDGVLVDSEALSCECLRSVLCKHGYEIDLQGVFDTFLGRGFSVVEEKYRLATGVPLSAEFRQVHRRCLRQAFEKSLQPLPGIEDVLDGLCLPFCVASSSDRERLAFTLEIAGLAPRFGRLVYSGDLVARGKPAPDLFHYCAAVMDCAWDRTLVIEDTVNGIRSAKAAGMTAWGFIGGSHYAGRDGARLLAEAGADRVFANMAAIWQI